MCWNDSLGYLNTPTVHLKNSMGGSFEFSILKSCTVMRFENNCITHPQKVPQCNVCNDLQYLLWAPRRTVVGPKSPTSNIPLQNWAAHLTSIMVAKHKHAVTEEYLIVGKFTWSPTLFYRHALRSATHAVHTVWTSPLQKKQTEEPPLGTF